MKGYIKKCPECGGINLILNKDKGEITCKDCGKQDEVNFEPRNPNDVLCSECFSKKRQAESGAKEEPEAKAE